MIPASPPTRCPSTASRSPAAGWPASGPSWTRSARLAGSPLCARVVSQNNFPTGAGIASSASAFAALALASTAALGLDLSPRELSRLARRGSGSACRSVPGGFVQWQAGEGDEDSYAYTIAPPDHWDLVDCIAVASSGHKPVTSSEGHELAQTSPIQAARVADAPRRLELCRSALLDRDFAALAEIVELDSDLMHAVMMTSRPALFYWSPVTFQIMLAVREWRSAGLPACYTIDAGPNVHVLTLSGEAGRVARLLGEIPGVEKVIQASPGGPATLAEASREVA